MKFIACTGAGGTGKGTLCAYMGEGIEVPSMVDYLRHEFFPGTRYGEFTKYGDVLAWQYNILYSQLALEEYNRILNGGKDLYVPVERSTIDYAAYMMAQAERFMKNQKCFAQVEEYIKFCIDHANKTYDYVVYFPPGQFKPADKEGSTKERDEQSIAKTDRYITGLLDRIKVPVLRLKVKSVENRAEAVADFCTKGRK